MDHDILLLRLQSRFGLDGAVLVWIRSFLSDRTQRVCFGGHLSAEIALIFSVPQGSVLGPLLFLLYVAELFDIIASLGLTGHSYADDTHVNRKSYEHISAPVVKNQQAATHLAECIERLDRWMGQNGLKLNAEKTQLMWLGSRHQLAKLTVSQLHLATTTSSSTVDIVSTANDLGVILDGQLTMARHISSVCSVGFFQLRQLLSVRRSLTTEATRALVQAFISCRLDYCNSLLAGVTDVYLLRLQSVQNAAARLVSGAHRHDHITPVLVGLHWLPVHQPIIYKTAVLVWKCLHDAAPRYLADVCAGPLHAWLPATTFHGIWDSAGPTCPDCYQSAQLRHQWTKNMEQSASRSENTRYDPLLLQATSQGPPVSAVVYAAAGRWAQHRSSGTIVNVQRVWRRLQIFRLTYL